MIEDFYVAGIDYNLGSANVLVTKYATKERSLIIMAKENYRFDLLVGRNNLLTEVHDYFGKLPSKIRNYLPPDSEINYCFRVASHFYEVTGQKINWSDKDKLDESILNAYHQFLGVAKLAFVQKDVPIIYYSSKFISLFFCHTTTYSRSALKLALYTQFRRGLGKAGKNVAYSLCLMESLRLAITYDRHLHLDFTDQQKKIMKLYIETERIPEEYVLVFDQIKE